MATTVMDRPRGSGWRQVWRGRLRRPWRAVRLYTVVGCGLSAVVLAIWGLERTDPVAGLRDWIFYAVITFFPGELPDEPNANWQIEVARIAGPAVAGYAVLRAAAALFRERAQLIGIRLRKRNHTVVAGLGGKGLTLATSLFEAGHPLVVIERDRANPALEGALERGIPVVHGDATDPAVLRRARVDRARHLVIMCGGDSVDVDVSSAARGEVAHRRAGVLAALVHLEDVALWRGLKPDALGDKHYHAFRMDFFNVYERGADLLFKHVGAEVLLGDAPPGGDGGRAAPGRPHVLLAGLEGVGSSLLLRLAREWRTAERNDDERLLITLIDPAAQAHRDEMAAGHPELLDHVEVRALALDPTKLSFQRGATPVRAPGDPPLRAAYVCMSDHARALTAALALAGHEQARGASILVATDSVHRSVERALRQAGSDRLGAASVFRLALTPELLELQRREILARANHDHYRRHQLVEGLSERENPSLVSWDALPESLKESNRRFADGVDDKLAHVGYTVVPASAANGRSPFEFSQQELDRLAPLEHTRWKRDLELQGWTYGEGPKDPLGKRHPLLVEWETLSATEREKDYVLVRELPQMLAEVGLEVRRRSRAGRGPSADKEAHPGAGEP